MLILTLAFTGAESFEPDGREKTQTALIAKFEFR
jgi:hypothetical protein